MTEETKNDFVLKDSITVEGITEDYVWYHSKKLLNQMQTWQYEFERMVNVMEARHKEHLAIIDEALRQKKNLEIELRMKTKEQE
jgi:hypothetical protein